MATTKLNPKQIESAAELLKSISHPVRLSIIALLSEEEKLSVTEIYEELELKQAVASQHLILLKNSGILVCEKEGKNCYYSLKNDCITQIFYCINNLL